MATIGHLSESDSGESILIVATATAGTTVHTAVAATDQIDMVHLYAFNGHTASVEITIEWATVAAARNIVLTIPADSGLTRITPEGGLPAQNSEIIAVFAGTTNVVGIMGKVVRSTTDEAFN